MSSSSSELTCRKRRPDRKSRRTHLKKYRSSVIWHRAKELGYTVDLDDLLFTPKRDFLLKNNGQRVKVGDLKGKNVVLYIVPIYESRDYSGDIVDMIQAYDELLPLGDTEFVFVPVELDFNIEAGDVSLYNHYFSTLPWPAIPFSDTAACGDRIFRAFSVDRRDGVHWYPIPYFVIIDPTSTVVATRQVYPHLFKLFGGAELHPFSRKRIRGLWREHGFHEYSRREFRNRLIRKWDQLLASPTRDFLLSSNGDQVPISSLKGKIIGLYFCENVPRPPRMEVIKKVYAEAKLRGYDFEIVQINFHYHFFNADNKFDTNNSRVADTSVQPHYENISWLTLPFKDPSCRKLQRIFECEFDNWSYIFEEDCLVIIDARQADEVLYEFSGAEIFKQYGIEGYPFTRQSLFETEYIMQKKELKLQLLFPPGFCQLIRPGAGDRFDLADGSQLKGKRVVVLFAKQSECKSSAFISMLESKYREQAEEENKFEVVYVPTDYVESLFTKCIKGMPWLVHLSDEYFQEEQMLSIFRAFKGIGVAAFDRDGELIAKECDIKKNRRGMELHKLEFPFVSQDLKGLIQMEVKFMCNLDRYASDD